MAGLLRELVVQQHRTMFYTGQLVKPNIPMMTHNILSMVMNMATFCKRRTDSRMNALSTTTGKVWLFRHFKCNTCTPILWKLWLWKCGWVCRLELVPYKTVLLDVFPHFSDSGWLPLTSSWPLPAHPNFAGAHHDENVVRSCAHNSSQTYYKE